MHQHHPNYSLTHTKAEGTAEEDFVNPLPRAVLRSNSFILLDGTWKFAIDTQDDGLNEHWYLNHEYTSVAEWPGSIEDHMEKSRLERTLAGQHRCLVRAGISPAGTSRRKRQPSFAVAANIWRLRL